MGDDYVKISKEDFRTLLSLFNTIIRHLPDMPRHERENMYEMSNLIGESVLYSVYEDE